MGNLEALNNEALVRSGQAVCKKYWNKKKKSKKNDRVPNFFSFAPFYSAYVG